MPWISGAIGVGANLLGLTGGGGGGGSGTGTPAYTPQGLGAADTGWQNAFGQQQNTVNQVGSTVSPLYQQSLAQQQGINYDPYMQAANQAGQQYGNLAGLAGQQANTYGQQAQGAQAQQQAMYGLGQQVAQTAFDPQQALYGRTQQQLSDQINAGQAARGLGTSAVGGQEYNQGMSNFNIDWQNAQLARQAQGVQAAGQANQAGINQGNLMGQNLSAQMASQGQVPTYLQQAAQTPLTAQQYVAGQPAANASAYQTNMGQLSNMYGTLESSAIPYMNGGVGATQNQQAFNANQQGQLGSALGQLGQGLWGQNSNSPWNSQQNWNQSWGAQSSPVYQPGSNDFVGPMPTSP